MMLDWHLTTLSISNLMVEHKILGDIAFEAKYPIFFLKPEQYPKDVHKSLKMLSSDFKERKYWGDALNPTISDIMIFNELLNLNLIKHDLSKYPGLVDYLNELYSKVPAAKEVTKPLISSLASKGIPTYIQPQKL